MVIILVGWPLILWPIFSYEVIEKGAPRPRKQANRMDTMLDTTENKPAEKAAGKRSKREKFVQLAEKRTKNAIRAIRIVAKLGNKNAYDYSEADVKKIASALTKEIEAMKARMSQTGGKNVVDFEL